MVKGKGLIHSSSNFSPNYIRTQSKFYGVKKDILEQQIWIYEIISQIQRIQGERTILKGGGAAQVYIPLDFQRCTLDIDIITDLNEEEIIELLDHIKHNFKNNGIAMYFEKYIPKFAKDNFHVIPMVTFLIHLPFSYNQGKKRGLKIDFLFGELDKTKLATTNAEEVLGLKLKQPLLCVPKDTLISEKILTFALNSIGLESFKVDSIYKNLYDLYYMINSDNSLKIFKSIANKLYAAIELESKLKDLSTLSTEKIMEDILDSLISLFTWDLKLKDALPHRKLRNFMETSIQRNLRHDLTLDTWAIIAMNVYVYIYSLYEYKQSQNYDSLEVINAYLEDMDYIAGFNKADRKTYKRYIFKTIKEWQDDLEFDNFHSIERLTFLVNLIENEMV